MKYQVSYTQKCYCHTWNKSHLMHQKILNWNGLVFPGGKGGYFEKFWVGMCCWYPRTLSHTRASSSEFHYPILDLTPQIPPHPRVAVFQKLLRSSQNKTDLIFFSYFWLAIPGFLSLDWHLQPIDQFPVKWYPVLDINSLIYVTYPRVNCLKTIPFRAAHTYIADIWQ